MIEKNDLEKRVSDLEEKLNHTKKMASLEADFVSVANDRFEKNLSAFKKYLPDIHDKFIDYSPSGDFNLFLNPNGTPNFVDYITKCAIYSEDPVVQVASQVSASIEKPEFTKINYDYLKHLENEFDFIHVELLKKASEQYSHCQLALPENKKIEGKVPSSVIFGVGLGYHLKDILQKVPSEYINIFEPEEDYFYASMFVFDWFEFLKEVDDKGCSLFLSIGLKEDEVYNEIYNRAQAHGPFTITNSWFFQHYPSRSINNIIKKLKDNFHEFFMGWGFIDDAFMSLAHSCNNVGKGVPFLRDIKFNGNKFKDFPVFILANGPSLDNDIEKIKELREEVVVIGCNSATTALLQNGIIPDFHVALERSRATYDFLEAFLPEHARKQMGLLTVNVMHQEVADLFPWAGFALKGREAGTSLHQISEAFHGMKGSFTIPFCNPLVGNLALSYMASLGFRNIYLFGVDNGYVDPEHHHSKSSMYYDNSGDTVYQPLTIGSKLKVAGNFGKEVIADYFLYSGKVQMERVLKSPVGNNVSCFNCSDGAKIEGSIPLRSDDIFLEKQSVNRHQVAGYVKNELFEKYEQEFDLESFLDFEGFEHLCKTLIDILSTKVYKREDALEQIMKQLRLLISLKETQFGHHYMVLEGEALYLNSIIINMLYNYGDEESIIPYYINIRNVWCDFLKIAPDLYRDNWNKESDHVFEF